jgi:hypothetical protein
VACRKVGSPGVMVAMVASSSSLVKQLLRVRSRRLRSDVRWLISEGGSCLQKVKPIFWSAVARCGTLEAKLRLRSEDMETNIRSRMSGHKGEQCDEVPIGHVGMREGAHFDETTMREGAEEQRDGDLFGACESRTLQQRESAEERAIHEVDLERAECRESGGFAERDCGWLSEDRPSEIDVFQLSGRRIGSQPVKRECVPWTRAKVELPQQRKRVNHLDVLALQREATNIRLDVARGERIAEPQERIEQALWHRDSLH